MNVGFHSKEKGVGGVFIAPIPEVKSKINYQP